MRFKLDTIEVYAVIGPRGSFFDVTIGKYERGLRCNIVRPCSYGDKENPYEASYTVSGSTYSKREANELRRALRELALFESRFIEAQDFMPKSASGLHEYKKGLLAAIHHINGRNKADIEADIEAYFGPSEPITENGK